MKIQLKRSNVLEGSPAAAKEPTADQMEYGELAVNYNTADPAIFIKANDNSIVRIAGLGNIADDGQVEVPSSVAPPSDPLAGNLWFNPLDGRLYVYYDDGNSEQWVDASPDSWNPSVIPDPDGGDNQPGTLDDRYVKKIGDNMTGDLTLGTDKITLNAANGSSTFAGNVESGQYDSSNTPTTAGCQLQAGGYIRAGVNTNSSTAGVIIVKNTTDGPVTYLYADGSASFAGTVEAGTYSDSSKGVQITEDGEILASSTGVASNAPRLRIKNERGTNFLITDDGGTNIGGTLPSSPNISLNANGSATFAEKVQTQGNPLAVEGAEEGALVFGGSGFAAAYSSDGSALYRGFKTGETTPRFRVNVDGSATFANTVTSGSIDNSTNYSYLDKGRIQVNRTDDEAAIYVAKLGAPTITLNADGSATFASTVIVGPGNPNNGANDGTVLYGAGGIGVSKTSGAAITINQTGIGSRTELFADGSATFAGQVTSGETTGNTGTSGANLGQDGFVSVVHSSRNAANCFSIYDSNNAAYTFSVLGDGSATFAGNIQSGNSTFTGVGSVLQNNGKLYLESFTGDKSTALQITNPSDYASPTVNINHDGSATFAGDLQVAGNPVGGAAAGFKVFNNGNIQAARAIGGEAILQGYTVGTSDATSIIYANGNGIFRGILTVSGTGNTSGLVVGDNGEATIYKDGSARFASNVQVGGNPFPGVEAGSALYEDGSIALTSDTSTGAILFGYTAGNSSPTILFKGDGSATFEGTVYATVVPPSDARFKENITPAKPQLADVVALGGLLKNYDWTDEAPLNEELRSVRQLGLVAQEVAEVCPSLVKDINRTKTMEITPAVVGPKGRVITEAVTSEVDDSYKGLSQEALIMKLIGAVAELSAEVQALKDAA